MHFTAAQYWAAPRDDKGLGANESGAAGQPTAGGRIGLYGGSFNPPHEGHLLVAGTALQRLKLDAVWWLVTPGNPLKDNSSLASLNRRIGESEALIRQSPLADKIYVTAFEQTLGARGSADLLDFLIPANPNTHFVWIMGADNLADFHHWHNWRHIMEIAPIAVINRPGFDDADKAPAAQAFAEARLNETEAANLALRKPPAWLFIHGRKSYLSSTLLRKREKAVKDSKTVLK